MKETNPCKKHLRIIELKKNQQKNGIQRNSIFILMIDLRKIYRNLNCLEFAKPFFKKRKHKNMNTQPINNSMKKIQIGIGKNSTIFLYVSN